MAISSASFKTGSTLEADEPPKLPPDHDDDDDVDQQQWLTVRRRCELCKSRKVRQLLQF